MKNKIHKKERVLNSQNPHVGVVKKNHEQQEDPHEEVLGKRLSPTAAARSKCWNPKPITQKLQEQLIRT